MNFCMIILSLLVFGNVVLGLRNTKSLKKDPKIVAGTVASISNMKYIVNLHRDGSFACGGALVSSEFVVTAAHCVYGYSASALSIHGGSSFLNQSGISRQVSRIFLSPKFTLTKLSFDVAVLKLSKPMEGKNIKPIPLCSHRLLYGKKLRISGWGFQNEDAVKPSNRLRSTIVRLQSESSCRRIYGRNSISNTMICAYAPNTDSCSGDSGGPLVSKGELCGIVSWGYGCAQRGYPGVYTNVNRVKAFIENAMKQ